MYGEDDVADVLLLYSSTGVETAEIKPDMAVDSKVRWEHWEDAVRAVNGDVAMVSLWAARRVIVDGEGPSITEPTIPAWFRAVDLAPTSMISKYGALLSELVDARRTGRRALANFVEERGIQEIATARALLAAQSLVDAGAVDALEGSFMRLVVSEDSPVVVQVDFAESTAAPTVRTLAPEIHEEAPPGGVTLRYGSAQDLIDVSTGEKTFEELLVNGLVQIEGSDDRLERFGSALLSFAAIHGVA
jgi:hypothetical protein